MSLSSHGSPPRANLNWADSIETPISGDFRLSQFDKLKPDSWKIHVHSGFWQNLLLRTNILVPLLVAECLFVFCFATGPHSATQAGLELGNHLASAL